MLKSERTRARILAAARSAFAAKGFEATSMQTIADAAGVDKALCSHYFGSKAALFAASTELPIDLGAILASVAGDRRRAGRRVVEAFLAALDNDEVRDPLIALVRSAASDERAAATVRTMVARRVIGPAVDALGVDQPELRATLVGSQLIGLVFARHILGVEPLASTPTDDLTRAVAPAIHRYLTGDIQ